MAQLRALGPEPGGRPVEQPEGRHLLESVAQALTTGQHPPVLTVSGAEQLHALALQMRPVFDAASSGDLTVAATRVNDLLRQTQARPQLDHFPSEGWSLHFHGRDDSLPHGWAAGCASGLALALGSNLAGRLGVCDAPVCDRVYVDTSKNSGRKFCSTRCQNRVKAATHRTRSAPASAPSGS